MHDCEQCVINSAKVWGCSSTANAGLANLPQDVLVLIFSLLPMFWLRSVRRTCRSFRAASVSLIRSLRTTIPRKNFHHQLHAFPYATSLALEVRNLPRSSPLLAKPLCSARLCYLKLLSEPRGPNNNFSSACDLNELAQSPHLEAFTAGLAAATLLTSVTLVDGLAAINVLIPACPQLQELELLRESERDPGPSWAWRESLTALRTAGNLHTLRFHASLRAPWADMLAELAHLPNLRSLGCVQVGDVDVLEFLFRLTRLTQLVVEWNEPSIRELPRLSELSRLEDLDLRRKGFFWRFWSSEVGLALRGLPQLQRLQLCNLIGTNVGLGAYGGLSSLTALELAGAISVDGLCSLVQPWTSRLQRLGLGLVGRISSGNTTPAHVWALGLSLTNLEDLKLRVESSTVWMLLLPYIGQYVDLTSLDLKGPGPCPADRWERVYRTQIIPKAVRDGRWDRDAMRLPPLGHLSRLTRLRLEDATEAREAATDIPALAGLTNLQVCSGRVACFRVSDLS